VFGLVRSCADVVSVLYLLYRGYFLFLQEQIKGIIVDIIDDFSRDFIHFSCRTKGGGGDELT